MTPTAELLAPRAPGYVEPTPRGRLPFERTAERLRSDGVPRPARRRLGDWPRTTRILPWMLAAMMAVVWLVPFNAIQLTMSLPIDLKFDRLVLPVIFVVWALMVAIGGPLAPVIRWTWIHTAIGNGAGRCLPEPGRRRALPQPDARVPDLDQEADAAAVLRDAVRDRREQHPARARSRPS